jgi:large subunit ribosomal protein L22
MEVKAEHRYAKISAFKVREVTREIQGMRAEAALEIVRLVPKKAARLIEKVLASAIANAENNNNSENKTLRAENRMHTRARGSGSRISKRSSHIRITLVEAEPIEEKPRKPKGQKKDKAKPTSKTTPKPVAKQEAAAAPALEAPEPPAGELKGEKADKTSHSLAAGEHPEKVTAAD